MVPASNKHKRRDLSLHGSTLLTENNFSLVVGVLDDQRRETERTLLMEGEMCGFVIECKVVLSKETSAHKISIPERWRHPCALLHRAELLLDQDGLYSVGIGCCVRHWEWYVILEIKQLL